MSSQGEHTLKQLIAHITGLPGGGVPLGGKRLVGGNSDTQNCIASFFETIVSNQPVSSDSLLISLFDRLKTDFFDYYADEQNRRFLDQRLEILATAKDANVRAQAAAEIWAPEIALPASDILPKWQLHRVLPNPQPYTPSEVLIQVNALYSIPKSIPESLPQTIKDAWVQVENLPDTIIFDYDHPVAIFSEDDHHELVACLKELDGEIAFEKQQQVFATDYKVPVAISVSVTHPRVDALCGLWLAHVMKANRYDHLQIYIITEEVAERIKQAIGFAPREQAIFSVLGKYANHFNLLKYFQLLLGKIGGIRAGFKIDSDEGIRSRDLFAATGKTWFQTLCHPYWGGTAQDDTGRPVYLGIVEGEYINEKDIDTLGYANCLRRPDVSFDGNYIGPNIFFNKGVAHARATDLYNREGYRLEQFLSHPVVKGGGFGIDNRALKEYTPFTLSKVGRAEDQQFYMAGLARGNRGIFTPDLRIAHYKQRVALAESKTDITRFLGDMFRLVIFQEIVSFLDIKTMIDPMPGVFAGPFARLQAFFSIVYKSYGYCATGDERKGSLLFERGLQELQELMSAIDSGEVKKTWGREQRDWERFVAAVDSCNGALLLSVIENIQITDRDEKR